MSSPPPPSLVTQAQESIDQLAAEDAKSTNSDVRYMAYGSRIQTALRATHRYLAYTSDVGEAFRPIVPPLLVTAAYGISWAYLVGDVSYETYKSHTKGPSPIERAAKLTEPTRLGLVAVERATFQAVASMALPALTIHTVVSQAAKAFKNAQNPRLRAWGPTVTGLALVPGLPFLFDHPIEHVTDNAFEWVRKKIAERESKES